jgi:hypothetical protein
VRRAELGDAVDVDLDGRRAELQRVRIPDDEVAIVARAQAAEPVVNAEDAGGRRRDRAEGDEQEAGVEDLQGGLSCQQAAASTSKGEGWQARGDQTS